MTFTHAKWIIPQALSDIKPVNIYHKEQEQFPLELPERLKNLHIMYRAKFSYSPKGDRVKLRISADDYCKVYINGTFVGMGPTQGYHFDYYWNEYDITDYLCDGENEISADVYYLGLVSRSFVSADRRIGLIAEIIGADGCIIATDESWQCGISKACENGIIFGYDTAFAENYNATKAHIQWDNAVVTELDHTFHPTPSRELQIYSIKPEITENLPDGGFFYDFGSEITGHLYLEAVGHEGQKVRILHGEECDPDSPLRVRYDMRCGCNCDEVWTLCEGENAREQYDYKAFRYAAVIPDEGVEIRNVSVTVRHFPFDDDYCTLETDNANLRAVWDICKAGVKYGSQETFVDCPMREKGQYAGDLTVTGASHLILTGDPYLVRKAIDNQIQSAFVCEGLLAVTPGALMQEIADYSLQFPLVALNYYRFSGDKEYLAENLAVCEGILRHFGKFARPDGLLESVIDKWNLVDWPENLRDGYDFPLERPMRNGSGAHNVLNAFYIGAHLLTEQIRDILGIEQKKASKELIDAFNRAFFNYDTGLYTDSEASSHSSLHSNAIPAFYGIIPKGFERSVGDLLAHKEMCCGVYMAYFVLKGLCRMGRIDDAYNLIISEGEHSWMNMVREGATTCFEAWGKDQKFNTSLCHPWASAPISVLAEDILPQRPELGRIVYKGNK